MAASMTEPGPTIGVDHAPLSGVPGVAVRGEIDMATAPSLRDALDAAIRESSGPLVVDLRAVGFLDSSGVGAFLRARALLGRDDRALVLVCPAGPVRRTFEVAGVADLFCLCASRGDAAAVLGARGRGG
jgi:anti-sigma B factor antagonist